jgi:hypothetical protein
MIAKACIETGNSDFEEQVGNVPKVDAHSVLSEVRAKLDKRVFYIEKDIEYHNECLLYEDVVKILSEHLQ